MTIYKGFENKLSDQSAQIVESYIRGWPGESTPENWMKHIRFLLSAHPHVLSRDADIVRNIMLSCGTITVNKATNTMTFADIQHVPDCHDHIDSRSCYVTTIFVDGNVVESYMRHTLVLYGGYVITKETTKTESNISVTMDGDELITIPAHSTVSTERTMLTAEVSIYGGYPATPSSGGEGGNGRVGYYFPNADCILIH